MNGLIIHEWAERSGGAEQVVEEFLTTFPSADLQVLWNDAPDRFPTARETWLARTPLRKSKALALPFTVPTWRSLRSKGQYEWLLVSSHLFAHHARIRAKVQPPKFVYAHTPARYIWEPELDPRGSAAPVKFAASMYRPLDRTRAQEATSIAANSEFTRQRIQRAWNRDAKVIYPPVNVQEIVLGGDWFGRISSEEQSLVQALPESFLLGASRFVAYKRLDLVVKAGEATGLPVVIAGQGPDEERLRALCAESTTTVHFVRSPSTALLRALYQRALAYVFPAIEDFGIMPVEAMAAGTPVVVPSKGGAAESVGLIGGGAVFEQDSPHSWREAIDRVSRIDKSTLPAAASLFSSQRFRTEVKQWVEPDTK